MKQIFLKQFNQLLNLDRSITKIHFEDPVQFREFIKYLDEESILSENDNLIDINKKVLKIYDPFNIDLKDKKVTTELYKCMKKELSMDQKLKILEIESSMIALLEDISLSMDCHIDYSEDVDITKIFSLFQVCLREIEYKNFLEFILNYIKLNKEFYDYSIVITIRLINILTNEEQKLLEQELELLEIKLIDFDLNQKTKNDVLIDKEWCVI